MDIPTLVPVDPFNPLEDATRLKDALAGALTDEKGIINVMCYRATSQRAVIASTYQSEFGKVRST